MAECESVKHANYIFRSGLQNRHLPLFSHLAKRDLASLAHPDSYREVEQVFLTNLFEPILFSSLRITSLIVRIVVYILYSPSVDRFYIGQTIDFNRRLEFHNSNAFKQSFTSQANDWQEYFVIECSSKQQAIKIEQHIKRMKPRKYLENLKKYPDLLEKMKSRFAAS